MSEIPEDLKKVHEILMSELFLICQPNHGDVFSFMDDHPEVLRPILLAERERATMKERERLAGWIAYELTRRMVIDMPTARAAVDAAIRSGEEAGK